MTARDIGKTAPRGREAPLLDLALVSNSGISLPYPRYIRKATALACPSQVRATSPVKRPRLWDSEVRAPVALICQYIDRHKERFEAWPICRVLSDSGTKIAPATALHHTTGHYPPGRSRDHPRSRGVYACLGSELAPVVRIIPARAGFTEAHRAGHGDQADHPRSRGVYMTWLVCVVTSVGSSPLARGLRHGWISMGGVVGIIPARAGFTAGGPPGAGGPGDHPRSRGVYLGLKSAWTARPGSSPLARGLLTLALQRHARVRIIPARAGFTHRGPRGPLAGEDHPRSRGVYEWGLPTPRAVAGSSPLARGLHPSASGDLAGSGIIPARAGFTMSRPDLRSQATDHPRSRGVYLRPNLSRYLPAGSSPLARGLRCTASTSPWNVWDHPRSRGVYRASIRRTTSPNGSSPLARGLLRHGHDEYQNRGIIPARAGFTSAPESMSPVLTGSSPLARGLLNHPSRAVVRTRIIPARAGFTLGWDPSPSNPEDHPRSRGVYVLADGESSMVIGSSPLARGLHLVLRAEGHRARIIPARAGFTLRRGLGRGSIPDHPRSRGVYGGDGAVEVHCGGIIPARAGFTASK